MSPELVSAATPPAEAPAARIRDRAFVARVNRNFLERYVVLAALIGLIVVFSLSKPTTFFNLQNFQSILTTKAAALTVSLSLTIVLAAGDLDLSIGGVLGFSAVFAAYLSNHGLSTVPILAISFGVALVIGAANAFFIVKVRVNALITTLAMGTLLDGVSSAVSNSTTVGLNDAGTHTIFSSRLFGVELPFWYALVICVVLWYVTHHLRTGRFLYFTGEGRESARLLGVRVTKIRVVSLVISALGAWLAGVVLVGQTGAAQAGVGDPYLLPAYAAAFLGTACIVPGRFNPVGTFVGAMLLAVGTTGLQLFGLATWVVQVFDGGVLIAAVGLAALIGKRRYEGHH